MSSIKENGIGSNYRTLDPTPISPFHDERVKVEIYPSAWEKVHVNVTCEELGFKSGLQTFDTEQAAKRYAINLTDELVNKLNSKLEEAVIKRLIVLGKIS